MNIKDLSVNIKLRSEIFADILSACSTLLKHSDLAAEAREYLNKRIPQYYHGRFGFGYFPTNEHLDELTKLVGEEKLRGLNLIYDKWTADADNTVPVKHGMLSSHNLIMPYKNVYGNTVSIVGRSLLAKEQQKNNKISKYKNTAFHKALHMFGLYHGKRSIVQNNSVFIVEGQFDCIACHARGIHNVVALGGVAFTKYQFALLRRYTNNMYLLLDNDSAGLSAADKIISQYSQFSNIQKVALPSCYKDIDEYLFNNNDSHDIFRIMNGR
jgi:DNA primase catalytic core